jgi:hypothetical protein
VLVPERREEMEGFAKLQVLKDKMFEAETEKRRHLGCKYCGATFYGYYEKSGFSGLGLVKIYDADGYAIETGLRYPDCPKCFDNIGVCEVARARYEYEETQKSQRRRDEKERKQQWEYENVPVKVASKLTFPSKKALHQRIAQAAKDPNSITKYEIMSSWFMDKVFWEIFDKGCHTLKVRDFSITKRLMNCTYLSNSGKTRFGRFVAYFKVVNERTGKKRWIGEERAERLFEIYNRRPNRRNDPKRNWGLPGNRHDRD